MARIQPKDLSGWYDAWSPALLLYARQWLDADAAEDVVQDAFIRLMAARSRPTHPKRWLFRVVRNAAIGRLRKRRRRRERLQRATRTLPALFEQRADDLIDARMAEENLSQLNREQREIIVMRLWGGMKLREISEITNLATSTVWTHYRAGLAELRRRLRTCMRKKRT